jgi:hypothetical protein
MTPEQLAQVDIAEVNLLCATGLPGAEKLDIDHAMAMLDRWAERVAFETNRHLYRVTDPRYAESYRHSEAYLRANFVLQALQEDLGVHYDMAAKDNFDFSDSRVAFIHGMIPPAGRTMADVPGGTCASMPVLYVAVGRRLGYPLKLVTTKAHVFARWDGMGHPNPKWRERFNIEGAGNGFSSYEDDHYKTWPFKVSDAEVKANGWLVSLTPMEEFAEFMAARGHCGIDNNQPAFAARCYENAYRYDTTRPCYRAWFLDAARQCGYRPVTPALAQLLKDRRRPAVARGSLSDPMGMPRPSEVAASMGEMFGLSPHMRIGDRSSVPTMPSAPQPPVPPVSQPHMPERYQPSMPELPR